MMRFCLSLTAHYSILHLTGSASFTDDPFNKCFSEKFLLAENVKFFNVFAASHRKIWVSFHVFLSLTQAIRYMSCDDKLPLLPV